MAQNKGKQGGGVAVLAVVAVGAFLLGSQKPDPQVEVDAAYSSDAGASFNVALGASREGDEPAEVPRPQALYQSSSSQLMEPEPESFDLAGEYFANCSEARAAGAAPVRLGDPGYAPHLDRDNDGIGCEFN